MPQQTAAVKAYSNQGGRRKRRLAGMLDMVFCQGGK
jgi:hypothetical protein